VGKLKALDVARQTAPGKYADGDGLYLIVAGPSAKNWSYRYWFSGKERWHGLGSVKDVSLADARLKRDAARLVVKGDRTVPGIDIVDAKRAERAETQAVVVKAKVPTFKESAERYIRANEGDWKNKKHRAQWSSSLATYAYAVIGHLPVDKIVPSHIHELLLPIWTKKAETANRVRGRIETILAAEANIDDDAFRNPAALTKQLREKLPKREKRKRRHHPSLPYAEISTFMGKLAAQGGVAARALEFTILTVARTNETLNAGWSELDIPAKVWTVPAERMKMGEEHNVPLCEAAIAVVRKAQGQSDLIFQNCDGGPFSEAAMAAVLKRMDYSHVTVHGFRATFATWAEECTEYPDGVREAALAHKYKSETVASYQRGAKLEKRRALMIDWAEFCGCTRVSPT
jgi:integrase